MSHHSALWDHSASSRNQFSFLVPWIILNHKETLSPHYLFLSWALNALGTIHMGSQLNFPTLWKLLFISILYILPFNKPFIPENTFLVVPYSLIFLKPFLEKICQNLIGNPSIEDQLKWPHPHLSSLSESLNTLMGLGFVSWLSYVVFVCLCAASFFITIFINSFGIKSQIYWSGFPLIC